MKIFGYSERGAMNALFYGMAIKEDSVSMRKFLNLAGISKSETECYGDFGLYMECSLSDFGTPDLVIIADDGNNSVAFFIEAKVSACGYFDLEKQQDKHNNGEYDASNLFFQLRSKEYFFNHECKSIDREQYYEKAFDIIKCKKGRQGLENCREQGSNVVVNKFADKINKCISAKYIAIIPEQDKKITQNDDYGFQILFVSWEDVFREFKDYLEDTIIFNQDVDENRKNKVVSQILNHPKSEYGK